MLPSGPTPPGPTSRHHVVEKAARSRRPSLNDSIAEDLGWMRSLVETYVPCKCYLVRFHRACLGKPWCLRSIHMQRLRFFRDNLAFELAMKGIATVPALGTVPVPQTLDARHVQQTRFAARVRQMILARKPLRKLS
jgi:hypothetical protein